MTHPTEEQPSSSKPEAMQRFRRWTAWTLAGASLGFLAYAVWKGFTETAEDLIGFQWALYVPVLALTLVNYGLRYVKWAYLLGRIDIVVPHRVNIPIFVTGLAMVITPAKAGELVKPWLVRELTGAPMTRTIPALVTERLTDGIAVVLLATIGVGTYFSSGKSLVFATLIGIVLTLAVLSSQRLSHMLIDGWAHLPLVGRVSPRLREAYTALRSCLSVPSFVATMALSLVAWWAECVGYWLIFKGLEVEATLDASTFVYAFATVFGAPSPGGLGLADAALVETASVVITHIEPAQALAAAVLVRVATLWFGVGLGAITLIRLDRLFENENRFSISTPS